MSSLSTVDFIPDRCDVIIQTIQQPKYPIAFECEMEEKFNCNRQIWTCGCLTESQCKHKERIVKSKTYINSEGRTEWVGKYIYN